MPKILKHPKTGNRYQPVNDAQERWLTGKPGWVVDDDQSPVGASAEPEPESVPVVAESTPADVPAPEPEPAATATRTRKIKEK